ncbi:hypothetical protein M8542_36360 [Amycolatopsis sp. OK19-0408]|uniref:DNA (cytosine-5-)-methyltransferase n=1 Tax=Amycolatopsis iheyensis TaxID=2945988 RepID=A0A9X2SN40_9PSEU|nr:hypothetical protein [Amycolatopsis iheyensis]MCR6488319.1 hypothetical protein [Amycolatopsis iheyensis]
MDWGEYAAAVHRWELITSHPAPYPTQPGRHGRPVLAPAFVEWLMGLPPGWVTAEHLDLPRTAQLRALGNGVMPQQAAHALRLLLEDLAHLTCSWHPPTAAPSRVSDHRGRTTTTRRPAATRTAASKRTRRTGAGSRR